LASLPLKPKLNSHLINKVNLCAQADPVAAAAVVAQADPVVAAVVAQADPVVAAVVAQVAPVAAVADPVPEIPVGPVELNRVGHRVVVAVVLRDQGVPLAAVADGLARVLQVPVLVHAL
jgi:hypothetical protein